jgi:hypothetical protein
MKNRLTKHQRLLLLNYLDANELTLAPYTNDGKAKRAEQTLGFIVTPGNVQGAMRLLSDSDEADAPAISTVISAPADEAAQYAEISATHAHGKVRPHLLTAFQREVEMLERIRRMEIMLCKLCVANGIEKTTPAYQFQPDGATKPVAQAQMDAAQNQSLFAKFFGGHGRIPG